MLSQNFANHSGEISKSPASWSHASTSCVTIFKNVTREHDAGSMTRETFEFIINVWTLQLFEIAKVTKRESCREKNADQSLTEHFRNPMSLDRAINHSFKAP